MKTWGFNQAKYIKASKSGRSGARSLIFILGVDPLAHPDKLHTTELGILRLQKNLDMDSTDVVNWYREQIKNYCQ